MSETKKIQAKSVIVTFSNGERYEIMASIIARSRAAYYADHDNPGKKAGDPEWDKTYQEEMDYTLSDDFELTDWAANNMNWSDVRNYAMLLPAEAEPFDYDAEFTNAPMKIVWNDDSEH